MGALDHAEARALATAAVASVLLHAVVLTVAPDFRHWHDMEPPKILSVELRPAPEEPPPAASSVPPPVPQVPPPSQRPRREPPAAPPPPAPAVKLRNATSAPATQPAPPVAPREEVSLEPEKPAPTPVAVAPPPPPAAAALTPPSFDAGYLRNPPPKYPVVARHNGEEGTVALRVVVAPDGSPVKVDLDKSSGSAALDNAALVTVKTWRFVPARRGADAVEAVVIVPVVFKLDGS